MSIVPKGEKISIKYYFEFTTGYMLLSGDKAKLDREVENSETSYWKN